MNESDSLEFLEASWTEQTDLFVCNAGAEAQLQKAKETGAALTAELEQSKAAVSAAEEAKAELAANLQESKDSMEAAERFKADLQPGLESFKGRILALEAQLSGDQPAQAHASARGCTCCFS